MIERLFHKQTNIFNNNIINNKGKINIFNGDITIKKGKKIKFNIYNFMNEATEVETEDKEIKFIMVSVISGDEFIHIHYTDGTKSHYKSDVALVDYYDGGYVVSKEDIQKWIDLEKTAQGTISYYRLEVFEKEEDEEDDEEGKL